MTRTRRPLQPPSRNPWGSRATERSSEDVRPPGPGGQAGRYRLIAAQQPNTTSSPSGVLRPLPPPPPPPQALRSPRIPMAPVASFGTRAETSTAVASDGNDDDSYENDTMTEETQQGQGQDTDHESGPTAAALAEYPYSIYNHGTWTAEDDQTLMRARAGGQNWAELQRAHFPAKTANACRKRYERLVERRGIHDYSGRRLEMVANEYMSVRRDMWSGLADRVGMRWEVVEALCMGAGLRTIQSNARSYTNRARRDNRISQKMRDAQVDAWNSTGASLGSFPLPALTVGSEFNTAFADRNPGPGIRSMPPPPPPPPPPPVFPASGPPPGNRLPPMVLAPKMPSRGYDDREDARSTSGPPSATGLVSDFAPTPRTRDW